MSTANLPGYDATVLAPTTVWRDRDSSGYLVQFHSDDNFLLDALSRFIGTAADGGDAAVFVVATARGSKGLNQIGNFSSLP
jgi:hypothetical protein